MTTVYYIKLRIHVRVPALNKDLHQHWLEGETVIAVEGKICMYIGFWGKLYSSACQNHVPFTAFVMFTHIFLRNINVKKIKRHPESI